MCGMDYQKMKEAHFSSMLDSSLKTLSKPWILLELSPQVSYSYVYFALLPILLMVNFCSSMVLQLGKISYSTNAQGHKTSATQGKLFGAFLFRYRMRYVSAMSAEERSKWFPLLNLCDTLCGVNELQIASDDVKASFCSYQFQRNNYFYFLLITIIIFFGVKNAPIIGYYRSQTAK